jgi:hypothetical protein
MTRARARLLAAALVIGTAGLASATVALGVTSPALPGRSIAVNAGPGDGGMTLPDGGGEGGFDGSDSGSFPDGGGGGFDGPGGGFDGPGGTFDAPMPPDDGMPPSDGFELPDAGMGRSISIVEGTIAISGPSGNTAMGSATIYTNDTGTLGVANLFGDSNITLAACGLQSCDYGGQSVTPPYSLAINCVPGAMPTQATLYVNEANGGSGAMAIVTCTSTAGPVLSVSPDMLAYGSVPVGTAPSQQIFISNAGGGTVSDIVISFGASPHAVHWSSNLCTSSNPCSVSTGAIAVDITFAPTSHGVKDVTLTVSSSNGGSDNVTLTATGIGGVMSVKTPPGPAHILDIGTIPRNLPATRNIELENLGNGPFTATTTTPAPPYAIAPGPFVVAGGATNQIAVTCQSATATATDNPQIVTITSNAYAGSPATVQLRCKIADTLLQITPTTFDYGEVRVGTPEPSIPITLTNPSTSGTAVQITAFDLREHKPGLSLAAPSTPFSIAPGTTQNATLTLATTADTDLAGEYLELTVDGTQLQFPVTGKVVTPRSRIVPPTRLDLGTACIGTDVEGNVMLINDGTATLNVQAPEMDQSFIASAMGVPGTLAADSSITAKVSPSMSASGPVQGTLTWRDDVPSAHQIEVVLDYVATGTALSPRGLDFGVVAIDSPPGVQQIRLQNCELAPSKVKLESLKTKQGTLGAWILDPRVGYTKDLGGKEQQTINVTFDPPARGHYEADLTVQTVSGKHVVHLVGDATGRDFDTTSFYACACNGPGAPQRGWPVLVAVVVVIARRRRVSS